MTQMSMLIILYIMFISIRVLVLYSLFIIGACVFLYIYKLCLNSTLESDDLVVIPE